MEQKPKQGAELPQVKKNIRMSERREHVFAALFLSEFHEAEERREHVERYFEDLQYAADICEQLYARYQAVSELAGDLDSVIEKASLGWDLKRIGRAELNILRLGVYEVLYDDSVPNGVAANEAVELAKKYGGNQSYAFVNGILSKVIKSQDGAEL